MVGKVRVRVDTDEKVVQIITDRIAPLKVNYNNADKSLSIFEVPMIRQRLTMR